MYRYYEEITDLYYDELDLYGLEFTKSEIEQIEQILSKILGPILDSFGQVSYNFLSACILYHDRRCMTYITKYADEWYFLCNHQPDYSKYYKCDQFDGLIQCIKDNIN